MPHITRLGHHKPTALLGAKIEHPHGGGFAA
jgi:hypothetical protein